MARTSNYSYVIDSTFDPFSFKELVQPLEVYKDAYEAAETQYTNLADNANTFKYLSESLPEGSKARAIYEGYANELNKQAQDFGKHGLNMGNRRALTNLKRRYQGEIGRLVKADKDLETEKALRRQLAAKDSSMLYAIDNLDIDQFLDGSTPNLYSISGTELYTRGAAAGKAASSRVYSAGDEGSTLNGYYRKWVERNGYSKESMDAFRANASAIPELQSAAEDILQERGVNDNLTGINRERAKQSVLNGIIDGAIYQEKISPVRDEGKMSAAQAASHALAVKADQRAAEKWEMEKEENTIRRNIMYHQKKDGTWELNPDYVSGNYSVDPNSGKLKKNTTSQSPEEKQADKKETALLKLDVKALADNRGFDVTFGTDRHHYNYIGNIKRKGDNWESSAFEGKATGEVMKVLSNDELGRLVQDTNFATALATQLKEAGITSEDADIQVVEVGEKNSNKKRYLIALH